MKRVLDLGNCDPDHSSIRRLLEPLGVELVRAHNAQEARSLLETESFDLVLVNRLFDRDGESGIEFIAQLREQSNRPAAMLISNLPEAQQQAESVGAKPGFGKAELAAPHATQRIKAALEED